MRNLENRSERVRPRLHFQFALTHELQDHRETNPPNCLLFVSLIFCC